MRALTKKFGVAILALMDEHIGDVIRRLRGKRRQGEVASSVGMSQAHWSQIECGKRPDPKLSTLRSVATALGVTVGELVDRKDLQP